jgi:endonuclease/exonuclease/phosphatase family metal-dependent hydrolase
MSAWWSRPGWGVWVVLVLGPQLLTAAETFTVATYNLENYLDAPAGGRAAKSAAAKAKVREGLRALRPDVLAVQEIGNRPALLELQASLKTEGLEYPYADHFMGFDTNIGLAVLSRFPLTARQAHTNEGFLLRGRRFQVQRGFAEVQVQVNPDYRFMLITAHLKSRREVPEADQGELREQEALRLRRLIDLRLKQEPDLNLVVLGDFNDHPASPALRTLLGRGRTALVDTRPAEPNGDNQPNPIPRFAPRNVTWTSYYGKEDSYSRVDYILLSPGMAKEWMAQGTRILTLANWGVASDHRPILACFRAREQ